MDVDWELFGIKISMVVVTFLVGICFGLSPILTTRIPTHVRTRGKLFNLFLRHWLILCK